MLILGENLSFPHVGFDFYSHWIWPKNLSNIYINSFKVNCYECWALGHLPTRAGPGQARVEHAHDLRIQIQFCSKGPWHCYILFWFYLFYLNLFFKFAVIIFSSYWNVTWPGLTEPLACISNSLHVSGDSAGVVATAGSERGYKYHLS